MHKFLKSAFVRKWAQLSAVCVLLLIVLAPTEAQVTAAAPNPHMHLQLPLAPAQLDISNRFWVAVDTSTTKTVSDMASADFSPVKGVFVAGYSDKAHWLRFSVSDPAERVREWWLELEPPFIDQVDLYESLGADTFGKTQFRHVKTGDTSPFSTREVPNQSFVFQISPKAEPTTYYVRLQSSGPIWAGARLWHSSVFAGYSVRYAHLQAAAYGAFLLLMLLTIVQGIVFKDPVYLTFVAHVGAVLLAQASIIFPLYLPDDWYPLVDILPAFATCLSVATYAIFCNYFVLSVQKSRLYSVLFFALAIVGAASAIACISPAYRWIVPGVLAAKIVGSLLPVIAVSRQLMRGSWYDRLVWLGLVMYVPAQALLLWRLASVAQQSVFWNTLHIYTGVLLLHMVLLTFALGERVSRITRASQALHEQLRTERLLKELTDRTARDQRGFLSMVAHEFRGPLAASRSATHNLRQMILHPSEAVAIRLERMDSGLLQMASLVDVCLTHEREGFEQPLSFNGRATAEQLRARLEPLLDSAVKARLRWPDSLADQAIVCNAALMTIAVRNLIENACRYGDGGSPIDIGWQAIAGKPARWRVSVSDRGPGFPAEQADKLFEPFARGHEAGDDGLGLGLYIVSRIASMHGATVGVLPREGGGSVFSIAFR